MIEIPLTKGYVAIVDDEDAGLAAGLKWCAHGNQRGKVYAVRKRRYQTGITMHRLIMNPPEGMQVDHINGNSLDNRRANLRICTLQENVWNRRRPTGGKVFTETGLRGIERRGAQWRARIMHNGKRISVGCFATAEEAARAYDRKVIELRGEFAAPNFAVTSEP